MQLPGMGDFVPVPLQDNGIDIREILQSGRIPCGGYSTEVGGEPVLITVSRRSVDDDGTFLAETGNWMLQFFVAGAVLRPSAAVDVVRRAAPVNLGATYIYAPDIETMRPIHVVAAFFSNSGPMIDAPPDFDWWKHSNVHRYFSVHRIAGTLDELMPVYRSLNHSFTSRTWTGEEGTGIYALPGRPKVPASVKHSSQPWVRCPAGPRSKATSNRSHSNGSTTESSGSPSSESGTSAASSWRSNSPTTTR